MPEAMAIVEKMRLLVNDAISGYGTEFAKDFTKLSFEMTDGAKRFVAER